MIKRHLLVSIRYSRNGTKKTGLHLQRQKLAYIILVELLAYQFASPVRWIETQDHLFKNFAFEIGPSPTLTGMELALW